MSNQFKQLKQHVCKVLPDGPCWFRYSPHHEWLLVHVAWLDSRTQKAVFIKDRYELTIAVLKLRHPECEFRPALNPDQVTETLKIGLAALK